MREKGGQKFLGNLPIKPLTDDTMTALIDEGCEFEGKLCFHGCVRIGGVFRGEIYTPDTLIISERGVVEGNIEAGVVIISGEVVGNVRANYRVQIHKPAIFRGHIITNSLQVEDGVLFEGSTKMLVVDELAAQMREVTL